MNIHIQPSKKGWALRKARAKRVLCFFPLRRDAIAAARAQKPAVIYVHNASGMVVIRIPEIR